MTTYSEIADRSMGNERERRGGETAVPWLRILVVLAAMVLGITLVMASGQVPPEPSEAFTTLTD
jgi:hypothetical protein